MSVSTERTPETISTEYKSLRDEILLRLQAQQNILKYAIAVAGLLGPLLQYILQNSSKDNLSSSTTPNIISNPIAVILLMGPVICMFLNIVFLKHHIYIQLLSNYISKDLGYLDVGLNKKPLINCPFKGWENFLTKATGAHKMELRVSTFIGFCEAGFPLLVGCLYLFLYRSISSGMHADVFFKYWYMADIVLLLLLFVFSPIVRSFFYTQRKIAAK